MFASLSHDLPTHLTIATLVVMACYPYFPMIGISAVLYQMDSILDEHGFVRPGYTVVK